MSNVQIIEAFGSFIIEVDGKAKTFATRESALAAGVIEAQGAEINNLAQSYVDAQGFEGRKAAGQKRVIKDFLVWQAGGAKPVVQEELPVEPVKDASKYEVVDGKAKEIKPSYKPVQPLDKFSDTPVEVADLDDFDMGDVF